MKMKIILKNIFIEFEKTNKFQLALFWLLGCFLGDLVHYYIRTGKLI